MPRLKSLCGTRPAIRLITDGTGRFSSAKCEGITSMGRSSSKKLQGGAAAPAAKPTQERRSRKIADESIEHWELRVWRRGVPEVVTMLAKVFAYAHPVDSRAKWASSQNKPRASKAVGTVV